MSIISAYDTHKQYKWGQGKNWKKLLGETDREGKQYAKDGRLTHPPFFVFCDFFFFFFFFWGGWQEARMTGTTKLESG